MELLKYDHAAAKIGLQQSKEVSETAYHQRLVGIQHDIESARNESFHPYDAYWSGEYQIGVDGRGNAALVTSELGMIPGRAHRENSNAMSDSMVRNVAYTLDQINEGNLPHSSWRAAIEQVRQFRAFQQETVTLVDGESMLGYAMNGLLTEDGIALFLITRENDTFHFESRLIGGVSEGAAKDLLDRFLSPDAMPVSLKEGKDSPLYSVMRGNISVDLKNTKQIASIVQDVLDMRQETKSHTVSLGTCRTVAANEEQIFKRPIAVQPFIVKQQNQEHVITQTHKNPFEALPLAPVYHNDQQQDGWVNQKRIWETSVRPWIIPETPKIPKRDIRIFDDTSKNSVLKMDGQIFVQPIQQEDIREDIKPVVSELPFVTQETVLFQRDAHTAIKHTSADSAIQGKKQQEIFLQAQRALPIITCVTEEKSIAISLATHAHIPVKHTIGEYIPVVDHVSLEMEFQKENEHKVVYEVDELVIVDTQRVIDSIGKSIQKSESVKTVMKLLWMMPNEYFEFVPVEEVEIAQDSTRTLQNLLHFLRKVVRTYCGVDSIRPRVIQKIASDKWNDEIREIEEYIAILKTQQMFNHLFATVN